MKNNPYRCLSLLVLLWVALSAATAPEAQAQAQSVSGTVTSAETRQPLPFVNVRIKGTNRGVAANAAGRFTLTVPSPRDTLVFSLIGHRTMEVPVNGLAQINVELTVEAVQTEALVVTGYREQERATVTGSVSSVTSEEFKDVPVDNLSNALAGRLSGITVTQNAGTPGRESNIRIRAIGTFNNSAPLFVIDGIVSDDETFNALSTAEVEEVTVLKDADAAQYGSRAANGVVLVKTKRGRMGTREFTYTGSVGTQQSVGAPPTLNAYEHAKLINDGWSYNNIPTTDARYYTTDELEYFKSHSWDWINTMWRDPVSMQHALTMTGGSSGVRYYLGGSYLNETGSFDNLENRRLNSRANLDVDVTSRLKASVDINTSRRDRLGPSWGGEDWGQEDLYKALAIRSAMVPPYVNGLPTGNWVEWHPGVVIDNSQGYDKRDWTIFNTRLRLDYQLPVITGLSANVSYFKGHVEMHRKQFNLPYQMALFNTTGTNNHIVGDQQVGWRARTQAEYLLERDSVDNNYQLNTQLNYRGGFGAHNFDGFLVYEQAKTDRIQFDGRRDQFISTLIDQFNAGSSDPANSVVNGWQRQGARMSYVGSLAYNYARRYFLQGSFRYDGSVIFSPERRWGFFPSVSAGWRVSDEPFFKSNFVNDLKLRASYGIVGNDDVGSFQWLQKYTIQRGAIFDSPTMGLAPGSLANPEITWEKSRELNVGADTRFWGNRMSLTLDVFRRNQYDILGDFGESVPGTFGASLPDKNYQEIHSKGFEAELGYDSNGGSSERVISYYVRGNFSYATNEIIKLNEAQNIRAYQSRIGRTTARTNECFGYIATGILRTQADLDALPAGYLIEGRAPKLGMLNYRDQRGPNTGNPAVDDQPDGKITGDDRDWICDYSTGSQSGPPINYGLSFGANWKALSLDLHLHGAAGNKHLMQDNGRQTQLRAEESSYGYWRDSWTPDNPNGAYPGWRDVNYRTSYPVSSFWLRDASFLRLKTATLAYELPQQFTNLIGADAARVYLTGQNLLMLSQHFGDWDFDPEMNNIRSYPIMRTFTLGMNVSLSKR